MKDGKKRRGWSFFNSFFFWNEGFCSHFFHQGGCLQLSSLFRLEGKLLGSGVQVSKAKTHPGSMMLHTTWFGLGAG